jgi:hypothetical protein
MYQNIHTYTSLYTLLENRLEMFAIPIEPSHEKHRSCGPLNHLFISSSFVLVIMPPNMDQITLLRAAAMFTSLVTAAVVLAASVNMTEPIPYHTSALRGQDWVDELLDLKAHPDRIKNELGVRRHVFLALVAALTQAGCTSSKHVSLEEKLAIFLYMSVTGLTIRHVGERFQRSNETISKYVPILLVIY